MPLSAILESTNDVNAAKQVCELAITSGRTRPARQGAIVLARLMRIYEDIPSAKSALFLVIALAANSSE